MIEFNQTALLAKKNQKEILKQFQNVLESGTFLAGKQNQILEKKLEKFLGKGLVTTTASGHDSLLLALKALNLNSNDEVILPANSYPTAFALAQSGVKLTPVDVDENGQLDPQEVEQKITKYTKVIVIVHLYGLVGNLEAVIRLAKKHKLFLIEDAAQSFGSKYKNKLTGTLGDIGCFSFYPTKNLGTLGDGGAIWTKNKKLHNFLQKAKSYGEKKRYLSEFVSGHSRTAEIQAAVLNYYLSLFDRNKKELQNVSKLYKRYLEIPTLLPFIRILNSSEESDPFQHLFVLEANKRDLLRRFLASKKIPTAIHYPYPIHLLPAFNDLQYKKGDFPVSERLSKRIISLPFHQYLTEKDIIYVVGLIKKFYNA